MKTNSHVIHERTLIYSHTYIYGLKWNYEWYVNINDTFKHKISWCPTTFIRKLTKKEIIYLMCFAEATWKL